MVSRSGWIKWDGVRRWLPIAGAGPNVNLRRPVGADLPFLAFFLCLTDPSLLLRSLDVGRQRLTVPNSVR